MACIVKLTGCQSGVVEPSRPVSSEGGFDPQSQVYAIEWATLFDSLGLFRRLQFPPVEQRKSPNIVHRANNVFVDLGSLVSIFLNCKV